jgi:pimeloyl-ACP methyl ester carboxylesterase
MGPHHARTLIASFVALAACSSESGTPLPYALSARPILPFPNDEMLKPDAATPTGLRLVLGEEGTNLGDVDEALFLFGPDFAEALERSDGWSTLGPVFIPLPEDADLASADAHVLLVDLDGEQIVPTAKKTFGGMTNYGRATHWIAARSPLPLKPKTRYAIIATRGLRGGSGMEFAPDEGFKAVLAGEPVANADASRLAAARTRLEGVSAALSSLGIAGEDVLVADTFTTQSVEDETRVLVDAFRGADAPQLTLDADGDGVANVYRSASADPRWEGPADKDFSAIAAVVRAEANIPNFRENLRGRMMVDTSQATLQSWEKVEALVVIPAGEGPFPIVVFQHGVGDRKEQVWRWAQELAQAGIAMVGFDAPLHGYRTDRPRSAATEFINIVEPALVVDNFRQAETEHVYFVRVIDALANMDLLGDGTRPLDASRLFYMGHSLGSMIGSVVLGLEPRYEGAALIVGGGTMLEFFERILGGFALHQFPAELFTTVAQTALDKGDPTNYAALSADKQILLMQAMQDVAMPPQATASLARAMALPQVPPIFEREPLVPEVAPPVARRGWLQYSPATHSLAYQEDNTPEAYARSRSQLFHFLTTWAKTGVAEIRGE